jgi:putative peptidoglycan binding protein
VEFTRILQYQLPLLRGEDVRAAQQALTALNVVPPYGPPDGVFGAQTQATVKGFQQSLNLHLAGSAAPLDVDGKIGAATWAALFGAARGAGATAPHVTAATGAVSPGLAKDIPIDRIRMGRLKTWMTTNFKPQIDTATAGTPVTFDLVCAIAGKETAIYWIDFIDRITPENLLPVCVFDATGDFPGTENNRSAFPVNAAALRADHRFGPGLTDMLVAESNKSGTCCMVGGRQRTCTRATGFSSTICKILRRMRYSLPISSGTISLIAWTA